MDSNSRLEILSRDEEVDPDRGVAGSSLESVRPTGLAGSSSSAVGAHVTHCQGDGEAHPTDLVSAVSQEAGRSRGCWIPPASFE